jgi:hypothetical protein
MSLDEFIYKRALSLFSTDTTGLVCKLGDSSPHLSSPHKQTALELLYSCCEAKDSPHPTDLSYILLKLSGNDRILIETAMVLCDSKTFKKAVKDCKVFEPALGKRYPKSGLVLPRNVCIVITDIPSLPSRR